MGEHSHLLWVVEDVTAQLSIQELIEVCHEALSFYGPLPGCVHSFQLIPKMTNLGCHIADMIIKFLEMLKSHLN